MKMFCGKMRVVVLLMAMTLTFLGAVTAEEKEKVAGDVAAKFHSKIDVVAMNAGPREDILIQMRAAKDALLQEPEIKEEDLLVALNEEWKTLKTECKKDGEKPSESTVDYSKWMSFLVKEKRDAHISSVIFPGTQGSGSYSVYFADTSNPLTKENYLDMYLDASRCALVREQDMTIAEQLKASSRYFHFRPMAFGKDLVDSFLLDDKTELRGEKLEVYFNQIADFLKKETSEVVIVDLVSGSKPLPQASVTALSDLLTKLFPKMMVPTDIKENEFTLNNLESKKTRVIVISDIPQLKGSFDRESFISESPVESNVIDLDRAIKSAIESKSAGKALPFLKISWILNTDYSDEKSFAGRLNKDQTSKKADEAHAALKEYITKQGKVDTKKSAEKEEDKKEEPKTEEDKKEEPKTEEEKKEEPKTEEEKKENDGDDKTQEKKTSEEQKDVHQNGFLRLSDADFDMLLQFGVEQPAIQAAIENLDATDRARFDELMKEIKKEAKKFASRSTEAPAPRRRLKQAGKDEDKKKEKKEAERELVDPKKFGNIVVTDFLGRSSLAQLLGIPASSAVSSAVSLFAIVAALLSFFIAQ